MVVVVVVVVVVVGKPVAAASQGSSKNVRERRRERKDGRGQGREREREERLGGPFGPATLTRPHALERERERKRERERAAGGPAIGSFAAATGSEWPTGDHSSPPRAIAVQRGAELCPSCSSLRGFGKATWF